MTSRFFVKDKSKSRVAADGSPLCPCLLLLPDRDHFFSATSMGVIRGLPKMFTNRWHLIRKA